MAGYSADFFLFAAIAGLTTTAETLKIVSRDGGLAGLRGGWTVSGFRFLYGLSELRRSGRDIHKWVVAFLVAFYRQGWTSSAKKITTRMNSFNWNRCSKSSGQWGKRLALLTILLRCYIPVEISNSHDFVVVWKFQAVNVPICRRMLISGWNSIAWWTLDCMRRCTNGIV